MIQGFIFALVCHDAFDGGYDVAEHRHVKITAVNCVGYMATAKVFLIKFLRTSTTYFLFLKVFTKKCGEVITLTETC